MNILMVSSESVPFSKSGGLADVVGALSEALSSLGSDVRVLVPLYGSIDPVAFSDTGIEIEIPLLGRSEPVSFLATTRGNVTFYFLAHPWFSGRPGIYGDSSFAPYPDNLERFMLLDKAVLPLCKALGWKPQAIHCHDWTCSFVPYLAKKSKDPFFRKTASILTIHNLAYQGDFSRMQLLGVDMEPDPAMFSGTIPEKRLNMLKTGIAFADAITTVSPTYAKEIRTPEFGCDLDRLLESRADVLTGIINGIDYREWDPETDDLIDVRYSAKDLSGKAATKRAMQRDCSFPENPDIPLFGMISRIAEQKGFVELLEGSPCPLELLVRDQPLQMVIVGTGDRGMEQKLEELGKRYDNLSVRIMFSNKLAHRVEAAADFFLMPSRYEPCGLNQLYSLRYGTIPVARNTGGLADSIVDLDDDPENGTGILFETMDGNGIIEAVKRALDWWKNGPELMERIRARGMETDMTWQRSARSYLHLYESTIREK
jgi:starch synthase